MFFLKIQKSENQIVVVFFEFKNQSTSLIRIY